MAEFRADGKDPTHGGEAKAKRAASRERRARERVEWEALHGDGQAERERFVREIQPKLVNIPLTCRLRIRITRERTMSNTTTCDQENLT